MKRRLLAILSSLLAQSIGYGQIAHRLDVSNYVGYFTTSISGGPRVQIMSPLGAQLGYSYHKYQTSSYYGQYTVLSSGKSLLVHGLNCGYEYALFGGENYNLSIANNTDISSYFSQRLSLFSALALRFHNLDGIVVPSNNILRPTVPVKGKFVGLDMGIGYEHSIMTNLRMSARTSVLIPKFINSDGQKGMLISFTTGFGAAL